MKSFAFFAIAIILAAIFFVNTEALPITEEIQKPGDFINKFAIKELEPITVATHNRDKRATCDLLSKFGVNHSACAAHCVLKKYKGGYCNSKAVCVCRR